MASFARAFVAWLLAASVVVGGVLGVFAATWAAADLGPIAALAALITALGLFMTALTYAVEYSAEHWDWL